MTVFACVCVQAPHFFFILFFFKEISAIKKHKLKCSLCQSHCATNYDTSLKNRLYFRAGLESASNTSDVLLKVTL